mgnify:CR=1 FL=1
MNRSRIAVVLVVFLAGLFSSNILITVGSSLGFLWASRSWGIYVAVAVVTGVFSLVIGTLFLLGEGNGYTEVDGVEYRWTVGDVFHVPPAMYEHQHSNDTAHTIRYLRNLEFELEPQWRSLPHHT